MYITVCIYIYIYIYEIAPPRKVLSWLCPFHLSCALLLQAEPKHVLQSFLGHLYGTPLLQEPFSLLVSKRRWCSSAGRSTCAKRGPLKTSEHAAPAPTCWAAGILRLSWGKKYPHWSFGGEKNGNLTIQQTLSKNQLIVEGKHSSACFFQQGHHPLSFVMLMQAPKSSVSSTSSPCKRRNLAPRRDSTKPGPSWSPTSSRWILMGAGRLKTLQHGHLLGGSGPRTWIRG